MIHYTLATKVDDAELRALLRDSAMPSWVNLSLQREPSFFAAANPVTDDFAVIARDGGQSVGMFTCSMQTLHYNGKHARLAYLGGLRVAPSCRHRIRVLRGGFASVERLIPVADYPFYFTSIASDNKPARRLLEAGLPGLPQYEVVGEMQTLAFPVSRGRRLRLWRNATRADIAALIDFYHREAARFQFAPRLSEAWIHHIGLQHFLIYGDDEIRACLGLWNQAAFKQVVATSYRQPLQALRPLYNGYATLTNRVRLPASGHALSHCFLAFAAFAEQVADQAARLIQGALSHCSTEAAMLGLHSKHPFLEQLLPLKPIIYPSRIYTVSEAGNKPKLDGRAVQPEVALL